jgi:hypothetical protein
MKSLSRAVLMVLMLSTLSWTDVVCSPTTAIDHQSRTQLKHRGPGVQNVSLTQVTVEDMLNWPNPTQIVRTSNSPIDNRENQAFTLIGDIWRVKVEDNDCDFHVEMSDPGNSQDADRVIVEIPQGPRFVQIRNSLIAALIAAGEGDLTHKKSVDLNNSIRASATGFAFFDAFHYSHNNPKRGHGHGTPKVATIWELHPVWQLQLGTGVQPVEVAGAGVTDAGTSPDPGGVFDFAIKKSFLETLENGHTIQPTLTVNLGHHSALHPLGQDCEMHIAGTVQGSPIGSPTGIVIEPPNLCKIDPSGAETADTNSWPAVLDNLDGKTCQVTGFPRIFTEHATGNASASNPNHVFEIHPALGIDCGHDKVSFANFLTVFPGMRAISSSTATSCMKDRQLEVRYESSTAEYQFRENSAGCGNFAIVEIDGVNPRWVRSVTGGHTAIVRATGDGASTVTLKVYTLSPSSIDTWLGSIVGAGNGGNERKFIHGLFTYDYFSMLKTLHPRQQSWLTPGDWTAIKFPLAIVAFGEAENAPWIEQ